MDSGSVHRQWHWSQTAEVVVHVERRSEGNDEHRSCRRDGRAISKAVRHEALIDYYRQMVSTQFTPRKREKLYNVYETPISVPVTLVWGMEDGALSSKVAFKSGKDAGCEVEIRPLPGVGHFVDLEAAGKVGPGNHSLTLNQ